MSELTFTFTALLELSTATSASEYELATVTPGKAKLLATCSGSADKEVSIPTVANDLVEATLRPPVLKQELLFGETPSLGKLVSIMADDAIINSDENVLGLIIETPIYAV